MKKRVLITIMVLFLIASFSGCSKEKRTVSIKLHFNNNQVSQTIDIRYGYRLIDIDLPNPTFDGHVFVGWFTDKELYHEMDEMYAIVSNIYLYAKWEEVNGLTFTIDLNQILSNTTRDGLLDFILDDQTMFISREKFI